MSERINHQTANLENLGLPINQVEFNDLIDKQKIDISGFAGRSFNIVFFGKSLFFGDIVLRFSEKAEANDKLIGIENSGYFDPNKHKREQELTEIAVKAGLPVPSIFQTGSLDNGATWSIQQKISGQQLDNVWPTLDEESKLKPLFSIGENLGKLHLYGKEANKNDLLKYWSSKIGTSIGNLKTLELFNNYQIELIYETLTNKIVQNIDRGPGIMSPVHLEMLTKHTFVDNNMNVVGVIDWETGEIKGDPLSDLAYTSFWNSEEGKYENGGVTLANENQFDAVLTGYNKVNKIDKKLLLELLPAYDAAWYANIIWIRSWQGNNEKTERRKNKLLNIIGFLNK